MVRASSRVVALLASALLGVSGCAHVPPQRTLRVAVPSEPRSLNPLYLNGSTQQALSALVFSSLLKADEHGALVPDAAAALPAVSADGLRVTYCLRAGVRWQDGVPLSARDVVFTYDAILNPHNSVGSRMGSDRIASVTALGSRCVRVALKTPYAPIFSSFFGPDGYPILPWHLLHRYRSLDEVPYNALPVGSGPYRVAQWSRGEHLLLTANRRYFGGAPGIPAIDLRFIPSYQTAVAALRSHDVDADFGLPANLAANWTGNVRRTRTPLGVLAFVAMNTSDEVLRDSRVRRALALAMRPDLLRRNAAPFDPIAGTQPLLPEHPDYDRSFTARRSSLRTAQTLLDSAGWRRCGLNRCKDGRTLELSLTYSLLMPDAQTTTLQIAQNLARAGIGIRLRLVSTAMLLDPAPVGRIFAGRYQLAYLPIDPPFDADNSELYACDKAPPSGYNFTRLCDRALDELQYRATRTYGARAREALYRLITRRLLGDVPGVFLWEYTRTAVYPRNLRGVRPSPFASIFWNVADWRMN